MEMKKMSLNFDLVIFDFDGVLVDSETMGCQVWSDVFARHGMNVPAKDIMDKYTGKTGTLICSLIEQEYGYHVPDGLLEEVNETTERVMSKELETVPGVLETLPLLPLRFCIASGSRPKRLNLCLDVTGLRQFFPSETVFSSHFVKNGKPAPDLFLYAAENNADKVLKYIAEGIDINNTIDESDDSIGSNALLLASQFHHKEIIKILLENNADVNFKNYLNKTALEYVANNDNNFDIAAEFINRGGRCKCCG